MQLKNRGFDILISGLSASGTPQVRIAAVAYKIGTWGLTIVLSVPSVTMVGLMQIIRQGKNVVQL